MRLCRILFLSLPALLPGQGLLNTKRAAEFAKLFDQPDHSKHLGCEVMPMRPHLNYAFRFVSGYMGVLPMKPYQGPGHRFAVIARVTPDGSDAKPSFLAQFFQVPPVPPKNGAKFELDGAFFVGEGRYTVDWVLRDRDGRTCRHSWRIEARVPARDRELAISIAPGTVAPIRYEPWFGVPKERLDHAGEPLRLTVLLHVTPLSMRRNKLHPYDETMLLSSVLTLLQRSPFTEIKLVAFNLDQQKEIFRQEGFDANGWFDLLSAIGSLELEKVPYAVLQTAQRLPRYCQKARRRRAIVSAAGRRGRLPWARPRGRTISCASMLSRTGPGLRGHPSITSSSSRIGTKPPPSRMSSRTPFTRFRAR